MYKPQSPRLCALPSSLYQGWRVSCSNSEEHFVKIAILTKTTADKEYNKEYNKEYGGCIWLFTLIQPQLYSFYLISNLGGEHNGGFSQKTSSERHAWRSHIPGIWVKVQIIFRRLNNGLEYHSGNRYSMLLWILVLNDTLDPPYLNIMVANTRTDIEYRVRWR